MNNKKKGLTYIALSVVIILVAIFLGIPLMTKVASSLLNIKKVDAPITTEDFTPPPPPVFENSQITTNQKEITLTGNTEPGALVMYTINGDKNEVTADRDGKFTLSLILTTEKTEVVATSIDNSGNESEKEGSVTITLDNTAPKLTVTNPPDGKNFYGSNERQVTLTGTVDDSEAKLTINDRVVIIAPNGTFSYPLTLAEKDNNFNFKATDRAGNETTTGITVFFWQ